MRNILFLFIVPIFLFACKRDKDCTPVFPEVQPSLHGKLLVVPINMAEYNYFRETMRARNYAAQNKPYGIRYSSRSRSNLVVTLLKPNATVEMEYGIIQMKGHTSNMEECFNRIRRNIVPGKTILISGGCESTQDICKYARLNIPAFTVNHIGRGPINDYLAIRLQQLLQEYSYSEAIMKLHQDAPDVIEEYTYPKPR